MVMAMATGSSQLLISNPKVGKLNRDAISTRLRTKIVFIPKTLGRSIPKQST